MALRYLRVINAENNKSLLLWLYGGPACGFIARVRNKPYTYIRPKYRQKRVRQRSYNIKFKFLYDLTNGLCNV